MKIEKIHLDWHNEDEYDPEMVVFVSGSLPSDSEFVFETFTVEGYPGKFYYGHSPTGLVRFFWEHPKGQKRTVVR